MADTHGAAENHGMKVLHDRPMFRRPLLPAHRRLIIALLQPAVDAAAAVTIAAVADLEEEDTNNRIG